MLRRRRVRGAARRWGVPVKAADPQERIDHAKQPGKVSLRKAIERRIAKEFAVVDEELKLAHALAPNINDDHDTLTAHNVACERAENAMIRVNVLRDVLREAKP